jgi:hypothetical protein
MGGVGRSSTPLFSPPGQGRNRISSKADDNVAGKEADFDSPRPLFADANGRLEPGEAGTFENFSPSSILRYRERAVPEEKRPDEAELADIIRKAKDLHEHLRRYGGLGEAEKPLVVAGILLALRERQGSGFFLDALTGDDLTTDGEKLFSRLGDSLKAAKVRPEAKIDKLLNNFALIKDKPILSTKEKTLGSTPLRFFAEYIHNNIFKAPASRPSEGFPGRFYREFVSCSGGRGQSLGVVLTPGHVTDLCCDLVELKPGDVVFDPCCGTGGFLASAMSKMIRSAENEGGTRRVKESRIHGMEVRDDMFTIATASMLLLGDGHGNIICGDCFKLKPEQWRLDGGGATVGLMTPPFSQAKNPDTSHLSELAFTLHLLDGLAKGGKAAVVIPVSAMTGKNKGDRALKEEILKKHTLEGVISLNRRTFPGVGIVPCAAVFTAGRPHPPAKQARFINFEDDGYETRKHLGLVGTERARDRRALLLDCWRGKIRDIPSRFMVDAAVSVDDEWLHPFFHRNDEVPEKRDFLEHAANYLSFEFGMTAHGRGGVFGAAPDAAASNVSNAGTLLESVMGTLFKPGGERPPGPWKGTPVQASSDGMSANHAVELEAKRWKAFPFESIFSGIGRGRRLKAADQLPGPTPYVSSTAVNNGVDSFVSNTGKNVRRSSFAMTVANSGSVGSAFFHKYEFVASDHVTILRNPAFSIYVYLFLLPLVSRLSEKYNFNREITDIRIRRETLFLPVDTEGNPDWNFMSYYAQYIIKKIILNFNLY